MVQNALCQKPPKYSSVDLYNKVEKLNVLGTVLYIAAHPDDENTRMISYFANERKVRTAYLSLTRGDGGQNLIGTQIWEKLGLIRTNELLQARKIDGGQQFFSRANDFGYSKHPDETLAFWNKDEVMHDIIKVIREFKPDIIVNRFDHRTPGRTHGHHTSSAMLSVEAFDIANNPEAYKDRLGHLGTWQPERVFFNTSWWFYGGRDKFAKADKTNLYSVDAGVYYPERGISNTEIAAQSRSMHKSQGFGSTGTRGAEIEYLELINGSAPTLKDDPLSGLDLTWNRVEGGAKIEKAIESLLASYNYSQPEKNLSQLIIIRQLIEGIDNDHWKKIKLAEVDEIITYSSGLYLEARSLTPYAINGTEAGINFEVINRSPVDVHLHNISFVDQELDVEVDKALVENERQNIEYSLSIMDQGVSNPFWLNEKGTLGMYRVADESIIGQPASAAAYAVTFDLTIAGQRIEIERDVIYKSNSPVDGEVYRPFYIMPQASVRFTDPVYLFPDRNEKEVQVAVKAFKDDFKGILSVDHKKGWSVSPQVTEIKIPKKGDTRIITLQVKGPYLSETADIQAQILAEDGTVLTKEVTEIDYDHIPFQVLSQPATARVARVSLDKKGANIAYLQGAGDDIPKSLRQIGYNVSEVEVSELTKEGLQSFDAVVMGIRAYNTKPELLLKKPVLEEYMTNGGTVVVQYNTSRRIKGSDIAPYDMELSRDRVTDEHATMSFELPDHDLLNFPNQITTRDFEGWVQERGLYFPNKWDDRFEAPLAASDKGESLKHGGLLVAKVGEGHFVYTGLSFFRQLPAGVPGAFRLFANMLSIGKKEMQSTGAIQSTGNE